MALFTVYILLITVWGIPEITVANDLDHDVGLRDCIEWRKVGKASESAVRPDGTCSVHLLDGHAETYLGCLFFPAEVWSSSERVAVSSLDPDVDRESCRQAESYDRYAPAGKAIKRLQGWLPP